MIKKEFLTLPLADLVPYENNPRHNEEAVESVMESIRQTENLDPIEIDENGVILSGHTRKKALQELGFSETQVVRISGLTEEQKRKYRLLANKTNEISEWDFEKLREELEDLDFNGFDFGWDLPETGEKDPETFTEDEAPEIEETTFSEIGDLWILNDHRLICGDSTDPAVLNILLDGGRAELLLTDPPYGINAVKGNKVGGGGELKFKGLVHGHGSKKSIVQESTYYFPIIGDESTETAEKAYKACLDFSENQIIFGGNYFTDFLPPSRCWVVWDKENSGTFADAELAWTSFDRVVKLYHYMWNGLAREGSRKAELKTRVHPTQKPVGLMARILTDFSEDGAAVLDVFGGSGSTLIACEQTGRKCFMAELSREYIDVIVKRYVNFKESSDGVYLLRNGQKIPYDSAFLTE